MLLIVQQLFTSSRGFFFVVVAPPSIQKMGPVVCTRCSMLIPHYSRLSRRPGGGLLSRLGSFRSVLFVLCSFIFLHKSLYGHTMELCRRISALFHPSPCRRSEFVPLLSGRRMAFRIISGRSSHHCRFPVSGQRGQEAGARASGCCNAFLKPKQRPVGGLCPGGFCVSLSAPSSLRRRRRCRLRGDVEALCGFKSAARMLIRLVRLA